jgi:hypothetical protein
MNTSCRGSLHCQTTRTEARGFAALETEGESFDIGLVHLSESGELIND